MRRYYSRLSWMRWGVFLLLITVGCALSSQKPDIVSKEKTPERTYSADDVRRMTVDQPHLLSGDYFRKRTDKENSQFALKGFFSSSESAGTPSPVPAANESSQDIPKNKKYAAKGAPDEPYNLKLGFFIHRGGLTSAHAQRLMDAANQAVEADMILLNDTGMRELIASTDCLAEADFECIARSVSLYPGVRMLVILESVRLPEAFPGNAVLAYQLMDTGLVYPYPAVEITDRLENNAQLDEFFGHAMVRMFAYARRKADVMPAHGRVFSVKNNRIYINAGELTGIDVGDRFGFAPDGETVKSPNGLPVAWVPDNEKGRLQVDLLIGEDAARCELIKGELPEQGAYVLFGSE